MNCSDYKILVVLPHGTDFDILGATQAIVLTFQNVKIVHPRVINSNAWDFISKRKIFSFIQANNITWSEFSQVIMLGISSSRDNPEIIPSLTSFNGEITIWHHNVPNLPFNFTVEKVDCLSFTAWSLDKFNFLKRQISVEDAALFLMAVMEKTHCGLAAKTSRKDYAALEFLYKLNVPPRQIANQISLGLREGQKGLFYDLIRNSEDIEIADYPIVLACTRSVGNVQEVLPVVDAIWSRLDPFILIIVISYGHKTLVWVRQRNITANLFSIFQDFSPKRVHRWLIFQLKEGNPEAAKQLLCDILRNKLSGEPLSKDVMISPPQCIDINETINDALQTMLKFNLMGLIVTRNGKFAGMISRRDVDRAAKMGVMNSPISYFLNPELYYVTPQTPLRVVKQIMVHQNVTRIPVVDGDEVKGIITSREVMRALPLHLPLPRKYLPYARTSQLPEPSFIIDLVKRVVSVKVLHLWKKIGEIAEKKGCQAYLVGGVVRDLLLERPNFDMDIVIIGDAIPFAVDLQKEFKGKLRIFDRFHTARLTLDQIKIDFSSARIEHYAAAGELPQIEFSGLSNDLFRRDFTINALALDLAPQKFLKLIDFFGGYDHLREGKIKILHSFSFLEDPTRIYRAIRFSVRFRFELGYDTKKALDIALEREVIHKISLQRICAEISRAFAEEQPATVLQKYLELGLLAPLHSSLASNTALPARFRHIPSAIRRFQILREPIDRDTIYWTGLLSGLSHNEADTIMKKAGFHADRRNRILKSLDALTSVPRQISRLDENDKFGIYSLLSPLPIEGLICLSLFGLDKAGVRKLLNYIKNYRSCAVEISGQDLLEIGIKAGPHYREIFDDVLRKKLAGELKNRREELEYVRKTYQNLCV